MASISAGRDLHRNMNLASKESTGKWRCNGQEKGRQSRTATSKENSEDGCYGENQVEVFLEGEASSWRVN